MKHIYLISATALTMLLTASMQEQKPIAKYKIGAAVVSVWENQYEGEHGPFTKKSFKVEKVFKKDEEWKTTNYFDRDELLQLRAAIDKAILEQGVE